jgi:hypothetical protein
MPEVKTDDGCIVHVEVEGPQTGPVLMLSNSLGTNLHMWDDNMLVTRTKGQELAQAREISHSPQEHL